MVLSSVRPSFKRWFLPVAFVAMTIDSIRRHWPELRTGSPVWVWFFVGCHVLVTVALWSQALKDQRPTAQKTDSPG